jgi:hypothetical protein
MARSIGCSRDARAADDAEIGLRIGEVKNAGAVRKHRREGRASVEASPLYFGDVGDDVDFDAPGLARQLVQTSEQLIVRDRLERSFLFHSCNIGRAVSASWEGAANAARRSSRRRRLPSGLRASPLVCGPEGGIVMRTARNGRSCFPDLSSEKCSQIAFPPRKVPGVERLVHSNLSKSADDQE